MPLKTPSCFCDHLHRYCNTEHCLIARRKNSQKRNIELYQLKVSNCSTCQLLYRGLCHPNIKPIWLQPGWLNEPDEDKLIIEWAPETNIIRTRGYGNGHSWRHFALSLDPQAREQDIAQLHGLEKAVVDPTTYTGSLDTLSNLTRWLRKCDSVHDCFNREIPALPSRVLHVKGDRVYVEEGRSRKALYVTLSYCWGGISPLILTDDNYGQFTQHGISIVDLPATYKDAITVMRQLDVPIEYLWIDALCIIQHNEKDWNIQSRQMKSVYGNTYLNICAAHGSNCTTGCFSRTGPGEQKNPFHRVASSPLFIRELQRDLHFDFANNYNAEQHIPALQRAWILQERLLAPRVVYFDRHELLWECKVKHDCQCQAITVMSGFKDYWANAMRRDNGALTRFSKEHPIVAWMKVIRKYSRMQLTRDTDRLVALDGIAESVEQDSELTGVYCSGLWQRHLDRQLTWFMSDTFRATKTRIAPTWSWASKVGAVDFCDIPDWNLNSPEVDISGRVLSVSPFSSDDEKSGVLEVEGRALNVTASVVQESQNAGPTEMVLTDARTGSFVGCAHGDIADPGDFRGRQQPLVLLWWGETAVDAEDFDTFLILRPAKANGYFERYGLFPRFGDVRQEKQAAKLARRMGLERRRRFLLL